MAERIARKVNLDLTTGDGTGDPNGIVTASTLGKTTEAVAAFTFDELMDLVHSIDPASRAASTCRFMFNDRTLLSHRTHRNHVEEGTSVSVRVNLGGSGRKQ